MSPRSSTTSGKPGKPTTKAPAKANATKAVATQTPPARRAAAKPRAKPGKAGGITADERLRLIAEAAYYKAEKRDFAGGSELGDWIEAEAEIDALLNPRGAG